MESYYADQIALPYFSASAARQRGSGLGALVATVGRFALPILRNVLFPAAKRFGRNLALEALPEVENVIAGKSNVKRAVKRSLGNAAEKSLRGHGASQSKKLKRNDSQKELLIPPSPKPPKIKPKKGKVKRSRYDILKNLKN